MSYRLCLSGRIFAINEDHGGSLRAIGRGGLRRLPAAPWAAAAAPGRSIPRRRCLPPPSNPRRTARSASLPPTTGRTFKHPFFFFFKDWDRGPSPPRHLCRPWINQGITFRAWLLLRLTRPTPCAGTFEVSFYQEYGWAAMHNYITVEARCAADLYAEGLRPLLLRLGYLAGGTEDMSVRQADRLRLSSQVLAPLRESISSPRSRPSCPNCPSRSSWTA